MYSNNFKTIFLTVYMSPDKKCWISFPKTMRLETHTHVVTYERISVKGEVVQGRNSDSSNTKDAYSLLHVHIWQSLIILIINSTYVTYIFQYVLQRFYNLRQYDVFAFSKDYVLNFILNLQLINLVPHRVCDKILVQPKNIP